MDCVVLSAEGVLVCISYVHDAVILGALLTDLTDGFFVADDVAVAG